MTRDNFDFLNIFTSKIQARKSTIKSFRLYNPMYYRFCWLALVISGVLHLSEAANGVSPNSFASNLFKAGN